ncbi:hypothetical protein HFN89_05555 [Rhizobium laguerreae]|nr:hypothetical protein [Rhizobium laguerreae]
MSSDPSKSIGKKDFEAMTAVIYRDMWKLSSLSEAVFNEKDRVGTIEREQGSSERVSSAGRFVSPVRYRQLMPLSPPCRQPEPHWMLI